MLSSQRDFARAEDSLRKAIDCDPGFPDAYAEMGQLLNAEKKFAESQAVLQEGLRRAPGAWQFYYQLANAHYGLRQYRSAETEYRKVQSLNTTPPVEIHIKLANIYLKESAYDQAYAEMQTYLRLEPNGPFATKIKSIVQQMESSGAVQVGQPQTVRSSPTRP